MADLTQLLSQFLYSRLAIIGGSGGSASGVLTAKSTTTGTIADTNETDLWSYTLPASVVAIDGRSIRVTAWGTTAATANTKTIKFYINGSQLSQTMSGAANNQRWRLQFTFIRTGATTASYYSIEGLTGVADTFYVDFTTLAYAWGSDQIIKVTGQNGTAAANDIVLRGAMVELLN